MCEALSAEKKAAKKQSLKMEASLVAASKTNAELEVCTLLAWFPTAVLTFPSSLPPCMPQRTIEALKLKNVIERDTLNNMHMKTIKVGWLQWQLRHSLTPLKRYCCGQLAMQQDWCHLHTHLSWSLTCVCPLKYLRACVAYVLENISCTV